MMKRRVKIFREKGHWAATPANYGIWSWASPSSSDQGDRGHTEIVFGFLVGRLQEEGIFHARDKEHAYEVMQARSLDSGDSWEIERIPCSIPGNRSSFSADEHMRPHLGVGWALEQGLGPLPASCPGDIDFGHPDFALMCARTGLGKGTVSWFYTSVNRCQSWEGPFSLSDFGLAGVEARSDYLVSSPRECTLFLTAAKESGGEGEGVFCACTRDGGRSFHFLAWVCRTDVGWRIMPASVALSETRILVAVRCHDGAAQLKKARNWIDLYLSEDAGSTWTFLSRPVPDTGYGGNPPTLTKLADGRICLTYGYRNPPYGIYARLSSDDGETWSEAIALRENAGNHDIGYPRTVQLADGDIFTVYWFNDHPEGERYIEAVRWTP